MNVRVIYVVRAIFQLNIYILEPFVLKAAQLLLGIGKEEQYKQPCRNIWLEN